MIPMAPITPNPCQKYITGAWRRVSLRTIERALRFGWDWWHDPRTGATLLHSPAESLYQFRTDKTHGPLLRDREVADLIED